MSPAKCDGFVGKCHFRRWYDRTIDAAARPRYDDRVMTLPRPTAIRIVAVVITKTRRYELDLDSTRFAYMPIYRIFGRGVYEMGAVNPEILCDRMVKL